MKPGVPNSDVHKNLKMEKWRKIKGLQIFQEV